MMIIKILKTIIKFKKGRNQFMKKKKNKILKIKIELIVEEGEEEEGMRKRIMNLMIIIKMKNIEGEEDNKIMNTSKVKEVEEEKGEDGEGVKEGVEEDLITGVKIIIKSKNMIGMITTNKKKAIVRKNKIIQMRKNNLVEEKDEENKKNKK